MSREVDSSSQNEDCSQSGDVSSFIPLFWCPAEYHLQHSRARYLRLPTATSYQNNQLPSASLLRAAFPRRTLQTESIAEQQTSGQSRLLPQTRTSSARSRFSATRPRSDMGPSDSEPNRDTRDTASARGGVEVKADGLRRSPGSLRDVTSRNRLWLELQRMHKRPQSATERSRSRSPP